MFSDDLALYHIQDWSEDPAQYWNLNNVMFGHKTCVPRKKEGKMQKIKITIEDTQGQILPAGFHEDKLYVGGEKNQRYNIRLRNLTNSKLCCVVSVDGRNVLSGDAADFNGKGYVVDKHSSLLIEGWRRNENEVAAFRFSDLGDSYASQQGAGENVGIIGVAVFEEVRLEAPKLNTVIVHLPYIQPVPTYPVPIYPWRPVLPWYDHERYDYVRYGASTAQLSTSVLNSAGDTQSSSRPISESLVSNQTVGTGYGEDVQSPSKTVQFFRQTSPVQVTEIRYNEVEELMRQGILRTKAKIKEPSAFPKQQGVSPGFAAAPSRRVGPVP